MSYWKNFDLYEIFYFSLFIQENLCRIQRVYDILDSADVMSFLLETKTYVQK